jgi:hypothetical protein
LNSVDSDVSVVRNLVRRYKRATWTLKIRLYRRRCLNCGFLGGVATPDDSRELAKLSEVKPMPREQWSNRLHAARAAGTLRGVEYDPTMTPDLGLDKSTPYAVMCALGRPEGPEAKFARARTRYRVSGLPVPPLSPGYIVRDPSRQSSEPGLRGLLGAPIASIQNFVWDLVRPHACPAFMRYREGLTPAEHVTAREGARRWRRDAIFGLVGIVLGALVAGFVSAWLGG